MNKLIDSFSTQSPAEIVLTVVYGVLLLGVCYILFSLGKIIFDYLTHKTR
jgi:hypothetical protein